MGRSDRGRVRGRGLTHSHAFCSRGSCRARDRDRDLHGPTHNLEKQNGKSYRRNMNNQKSIKLYRTKTIKLMQIVVKHTERRMCVKKGYQRENRARPCGGSWKSGRGRDRKRSGQGGRHLEFRRKKIRMQNKKMKFR